jgi:hypothetical protein
MEIKLNKKSFKSQAKKQHAALKDRCVEVKLSDIQESLAVAYGYENLATLYAKFKGEDYLVVDATPLRMQTDNLFVVTWFFNDAVDSGPTDDEVMGIYPPGTSLDDVTPRKWDQFLKAQYSELAIPEGMVFSEETVALHNFAMVPNISKYGLHDGAHESTVTQWVQEFMGFRVPKDGVEVSVYEMSDDGGCKDHVLIWLNDEDSAKVRALFDN